MTEFDSYDIGVRVKEIDPDLSVTWDWKTKNHKVFWKGEFIMGNPYPALDARLLTKIREIDTWSRQFSYDPGRVVRDSEEAQERAYNKKVEELSTNLATEALGAVKHDLGVA